MAITHATSTGPIGEAQWLENHTVDAAALRAALNVADGATANASDVHLLARANHTGTQAVSTITGLGTAATTDAADYATAAQGIKADNALPANGGTIQTYAETPDTLTSTAGALTIPLDGKTYTVTVTEDTAVTFSLPASGRGSAISHFIQDTIGGSVVSFPAATEWADSTATDVATGANARTRAVFTQFSSTGVDADLEVRGVVA